MYFCVGGEDFLNGRHAPLLGVVLVMWCVGRCVMFVLLYGRVVGEVYCCVPVLCCDECRCVYVCVCM